MVWFVGRAQGFLLSSARGFRSRWISCSAWSENLLSSCQNGLLVSPYGVPERPKTWQWPSSRDRKRGESNSLKHTNTSSGKFTNNCCHNCNKKEFFQLIFGVAAAPAFASISASDFQMRPVASLSFSSKNHQNSSKNSNTTTATIWSGVAVNTDGEGGRTTTTRKRREPWNIY